MDDKDWEVVVGRKSNQPKSSKLSIASITKKANDKRTPQTSPRSNAIVKHLKTEGNATIGMSGISNVKKRNKGDKLNGGSNQSKKSVPPTKTTSVALFDLVILSTPKTCNNMPISLTASQLNITKQAVPVSIHQQTQQKPSAPTSNKISDELKPKSFVVKKKKKKKKMISKIKKRILLVSMLLNLFLFF